MLNRDVFVTDPDAYRIANQGVAKISFPPSSDARETLRGELETFVCDGAYASGLAKILEAFLRAAGRGSAPAVWISGFYGSGKSHLASMLAALWTDLQFPDGARAQGIVPHIPPEVVGPLHELRIAARRMGGVLAAGDTLGSGPDDPVEATLSIILRAVDLPTDVRAAQVALWLADEGILDDVRSKLGSTFDSDIRNFILSSRFHTAVLAAKPSVALDPAGLRADLRANFQQPPKITVDFLTAMTRQTLLLGRTEIPLTVVVLDEVQQFIRTDPGLALQVQTVAERLSNEFDGRVLLVCTGQQALTDVQDLQKLLGRFPVQIALGEADIDAVIRQTVLRKKPDATDAIGDMLSRCAGEISRHIHGSRLAHTAHDDIDAILDWPLLPSRRRVWERILRELDRTGLGGTLRGQLRTTLDAARATAGKPLGHSVSTDFLYSRFADEAFNAGLLPGETRSRIEKLRAGTDDDPLKARVLMLVYMLGRIQGDVDFHGVRPQAETIADLLIENLDGEPDLRRKVPETLQALLEEGTVIEVDGDWRLQTKESAEWEQAFRGEERQCLADQAGIARVRRERLYQTITDALSGTRSVTHGRSNQPRKIQKLLPDEKPTGDGVVLRLHNGWEEDLLQLEREIAAAPPTDATIHLLVPRHRADELVAALVNQKAAEAVIGLKGVPQSNEGKEALAAMESRASRSEKEASTILGEAVARAQVVQAGGTVVSGADLPDALKKAALNSLARLYPQFGDADHPGWEKVVDRARRKNPDAVSAIDHQGPPENHPVCKAVLAYLGPGRKGADIRAHFGGSPFGWPQDAIEGALMVLANAGQLRVAGEDGKPASLSDIPRARIGQSTFRAETVVITMPQRLAARGLLNDTGLPFEPGQEAYALSGLLDRLEAAANQAGGPAPAPAPPVIADMATLRGLSGNDLLAALADRAGDLRAQLKDWREAAQTISTRLPRWNLAERLVTLGASSPAAALDAVRSGRSLLAELDPVPSIVQAGADELRTRLNSAWAACQAAWARGEERLKRDASWQELTPDQRRALRESCGLLEVPEPKVAKPEDIVEELQARSLAAWSDLAKALPTRVEDALAEAAALLEPKVRTLTLPGGILRTEPELDAWLADLRARIAKELPDGPVIPKV
jgi:hypothetical protein